ncbi:hypothetical protein JCM6882_001997 [Rhodosporidiobolus microsporus]
MRLLALALFPLLALAAPTDPDFLPAAQHPFFSPATSSGSSPKILLLRHGEKPPNRGVGLNCVGMKRAHCLRKLLAPSSAHTIGLIISQSYNKKTGHRKRSFDTISPLAEDWGLEVDHECYKMNPECTARKVREYVEAGGEGDVVIAWKGMMIGAIAKALGVENPPHYPGNRYDLIWTIQDGQLLSQEPENCPGIPAFPPWDGRGPPLGGPHGPGAGEGEGRRPPWGESEGGGEGGGDGGKEGGGEILRRGPEEVGAGEEDGREDSGEGESCDVDDYLDSHDWSWVGKDAAEGE